MLTQTIFQVVDTYINLSVCRMENLRYWSHMSSTTDGNYIKKICQSVGKTATRGKRQRQKKTKMTTAQLFAHENAIKELKPCETFLK